MNKIDAIITFLLGFVLGGILFGAITLGGLL